MKQERIARVNRLLQITLAEMIPSLVKDPRVRQVAILSVTAVRTSPDLHQARVYLSMTGSERERREAMLGLQGARGFLQAELGRRVRLRFTPQLIFELDSTIEEAARIEQILQELDRGGEGDGER